MSDNYDPEKDSYTDLTTGEAVSQAANGANDAIHDAIVRRLLPQCSSITERDLRVIQLGLVSALSMCYGGDKQPTGMMMAAAEKVDYLMQQFDPPQDQGIPTT